MDPILGSYHGELKNILELICDETGKFNLRLDGPCSCKKIIFHFILGSHEPFFWKVQNSKIFFFRDEPVHIVKKNIPTTTMTRSPRVQYLMSRSTLVNVTLILHRNKLMRPMLTNNLSNPVICYSLMP